MNDDKWAVKCNKKVEKWNKYMMNNDKWVENSDQWVKKCYKWIDKWNKWIMNNEKKLIIILNELKNMINE